MRAIQQAKDEGHLKAETDPALMLFELYSFTLGLHHDARFLHLPDAVQLTRDALEKTIVSYQSRANRKPTATAKATAVSGVDRAEFGGGARHQD